MQRVERVWTYRILVLRKQMTNRRRRIAGAKWWAKVGHETARLMERMETCEEPVLLNWLKNALRNTDPRLQAFLIADSPTNSMTPARQRTYSNYQTSINPLHSHEHNTQTQTSCGPTSDLLQRSPAPHLIHSTVHRPVLQVEAIVYSDIFACPIWG